MSDHDQRPTDGTEIRQAVVHACVAVVFTIATYLVAMASADPLQTILVIATPIVMLIGALSCLWRTYRSWQLGGRWQIWQGASWFLLASFVVTLMSAAPALLD